MDLTEKSLNSFISPVEVNPLGQTETKNDIKFGQLLIQSRVTGWHVVTLDRQCVCVCVCVCVNVNVNTNSG